MKKRICALVLGTMMLAMAACGQSIANSAGYMNGVDQVGAKATESYSQASAAIVSEEAGFGEGMDASAEIAENEDAAANRKLIKTVNMSVETKEYDQLFQTLQTQVETLGGYIESMEVYNGSVYYEYRNSRSASLRIRIPESQLDSFLNTISDISNVTYRTDTVEDVTLQYVDLESHRNALRTEQSRLLELMEQAETVEDIITIEERLSNIRYQLESMESQLRTLENQVDYSTIYLDIEEVRELTPVHEETAWERITGGFVQSLKDIGNDLKEFIIWVLIHLPYLVIWAVIVAVVVLIVLKSKKNRKKSIKKAEKALTQPLPGVPVQEEKQETEK